MVQQTWQKTTSEVNFTSFFPNLDEIYPLMGQAATVLYLLAKNSGAAHPSPSVCLDG